MIGYADYVNRFLDECKDSLRSQSYDNFSVYIIDNCSINHCEYIKKTYPEAIAVERPDGNYAAANNLGMKMALEDGCEYLVIANMDTKFEVDWLSELVDALESDEKIGMAQSKMLLYPKNEEEKKHPRLNSTGNMMHFLGFGFTKDYNELDYEIESLPEIKGYVSGCSFITKKEVIEKVGMENEDLWMYHDDVEFSWKVKLAGYKIVLAPESRMFHKYEFSRSIRMLYYMERNRILVMLYFYKLPTLLLLLPAILAMDAGMTLYSVPGRWFGTKMKVFGYFLKPSTWMSVMKHRQKVRSFRVARDKEIVKGFVGKVMFQEIENPVLKYIANPIFDLYWRIVKKLIVW